MSFKTPGRLGVTRVCRGGGVVGLVPWLWGVWSGPWRWDRGGWSGGGVVVGLGPHPPPLVWEHFIKKYGRGSGSTGEWLVQLRVRRVPPCDAGGQLGCSQSQQHWAVPRQWPAPSLPIKLWTTSGPPLPVRPSKRSRVPPPLPPPPGRVRSCDSG